MNDNLLWKVNGESRMNPVKLQVLSSLSDGKEWQKVENSGRNDSLGEGWQVPIWVWDDPSKSIESRKSENLLSLRVHRRIKTF